MSYRLRQCILNSAFMGGDNIHRIRLLLEGRVMLQLIYLTTLTIS